MPAYASSLNGLVGRDILSDPSMTVRCTPSWVSFSGGVIRDLSRKIPQKGLDEFRGQSGTEQGVSDSSKSIPEGDRALLGVLDAKLLLSEPCSSVAKKRPERSDVFRDLAKILTI